VDLFKNSGTHDIARHLATPGLTEVRETTKCKLFPERFSLFDSFTNEFDTKHLVNNLIDPIEPSA
jgi:hypothetical protein